MKNYPWTFDDLILALDFHLAHGPLRRENRQEFALLTVILLPHSEDSVKAQLRNFVFLESNGHEGPSHVSKNARRVWNEFADDPKRLRSEARNIRGNRRTWRE